MDGVRRRPFAWESHAVTGRRFWEIARLLSAPVLLIGIRSTIQSMSALFTKNRIIRAFSLIELLVVIAIIGVFGFNAVARLERGDAAGEGE